MIPQTPVDMNQNLFRQFVYMSTSSFFNMVSVNGYAIREAGPFTESIHTPGPGRRGRFPCRAAMGKDGFRDRMGSARRAVLPVIREFYYTSTYARHRTSRVELVQFPCGGRGFRAWRVEGSTVCHRTSASVPRAVCSLHPPGTGVEGDFAYSRNMSFHAYDAVQSGFVVSYAMPIHRAYKEESGEVELHYPIRFTAGMQQEIFLQFRGRQQPTTQTVRKNHLILKSGPNENLFSYYFSSQRPPVERICLSHCAGIAARSAHQPDDSGRRTDRLRVCHGREGNPLRQDQEELPGFDVIRCWKFNRLATPLRLLNTIEKVKPDVVWFNLVFSTFATPDHPVAAFAGLSVPASDPSSVITRTSPCTTSSSTSISPAPEFGRTDVSSGKRPSHQSPCSKQIRFRSCFPDIGARCSRNTQPRMSCWARTGYLRPSESSGFFKTRKSRPPHPGDWTLGDLQAPGDLMEALPMVLKRVPSQIDRCRGQPSHQARLLGIDPRITKRCANRVSRICAEDAIPDLFGTTSVVVMPYDSATGPAVRRIRPANSEFHRMRRHR